MICKYGHERIQGKRCAECHRLECRARYAAHPEKWGAYHSRQDLGKKRAATKAWKLANPERHKAYTDAYNAKYRAEHPGYEAQWRAQNPEASRMRSSRYRANKYSAFGSHTDAEWQAIVSKQGGKCLDCGEKKRLERDHIVPISLGGSDMACNIAGRCRSCNASKSNSLQHVTQFSIFDSLAYVGGLV